MCARSSGGACPAVDACRDVQQLEDLPLDDPATYEIFTKAYTSGVFQFESQGMRDILRRYQPARIEDLIAELKQRYTIVIVTHNMQQAARASDYTVFMYQGSLIEYGPTPQMFTKPRNKQTEDYITGRFG